MRGVGGGAIQVLLMTMLVLGACGGVSAEVETFCADYLGVDELLNSGPDETDPTVWVDEVSAGLEGLKASAPEQVSVPMGRIADALLVPIAALDEEAFFGVLSSAGFVEDSRMVKAYLVDKCGWATVGITAIDYAFQADLEGIGPGTTAFSLDNAGSELHEVALIRINADTSETVEELLELPEEEVGAKASFLGVTFAAPGKGDVLFADLEEGRYVIVCFIPVGSTSFEDAEAAEGPPHFTQGMVRAFTVEA